MNFLTLCLSLLATLSSVSASETKVLYGEYSMSHCTQTQNNGRQGFVTEGYAFEASGNFEFNRQWFENSTCEGTPVEVEKEAGTFTIGKETTNGGFNPAGTYEIDFSVKGKVDKGIVWTNSENSQLRISRGLKGGMRNTMLSFFIYQK